MGKVAVKKKGKNDNNTQMVSDGFLKYFRWILIGLLMVVVFYPPYLRGLYFEAEQIPTEIYVFIIFAAFWIYKYLKKDKVFIETPIEYAVLGFTIVYFISIFAAVSTRSAIAEWLKYCMYFVVFYMVSQLCNTYRSRLLVLWTIVASAIGVCILGIDGAAGNGLAIYLNDIFKSLGANRDIFFGLFVQGRINSTLQYPNALAAYVLAVYILAMGLTVASKKLLTQAIGCVSSFVLLLTFIFTYSRGAYLLFPFVLLILIVLMPKQMRIRTVGFTAPSVISLSCVYIKISQLIENGQTPIKIWMMVGLGMVLSFILSILVSITIKWFEKIKWYIYAMVFGVVVVVATFGIIYASGKSVPVELSHAVGEKDDYISFSKEITVEPGKNYKVQIDVKVEGQIKEKPCYYKVDIRSKNEKNILFGESSEIGILEGYKTAGYETKEINIKVPEDSKIIVINLGSYYEGSKSIYNNLRIVDLENPKNIRNIALKYKYIPDTIVKRFDNMFKSASSLQRNIYYKDGMNILKDHWLLGAGGGSWPLLYFSYQTYLYFTTQAHNYILQLGIECGVIGLLALALLLLAIIYSAFKGFVYRNRIDTQKAILQASLFAAICAMFMHSLIDFDLSLSAVFLLLWQLIAIFNSIGQSEYKELQNVEDDGLKRILKRLNSIKKLPTVNVLPMLGLIMTLVFIVLPIRLNFGAAYEKEASVSLQTNNIQAALKSLKSAISFDNFSDQYKVEYAYYLIQQNPNKIQQKDLLEASKYVEGSEKSIRNNATLAVQAGSFYFATGNIDKGLAFIDRAVELAPFNPAGWQNKAEAYYQAIIHYLSKGDRSNYEKYLDKVIGLIDEAKDKNKRNIDDFAFNSDTSLILEKAFYLKEYPQNISDVNKLAFLSINDMDIKGDGVPDQWESYTSYDVFKGQSGKLQIKSKPNTVCDISSRDIKFTGGKSYKIEMKIADSSSIKKLNYLIGEDDKTAKEFVKDGNLYTSYISIDGTSVNSKSKLRLQINGECEIEYIKILEQ